jgi:hypothetical protein
MLSAAESRRQNEVFVRQCSLDGLRQRLPLQWPTPADTPPSPKQKYRSHYRHLGFEDLLEADWAEAFSPFDLLLRLIDFEGLRPVLAQRLGWQSAQGKVPFDPLSLFLLHGWQQTNGWSRAETLRQLKKGRNADYARRFGFQGDDFPTEGGLRHFLTALGQHSEQADQTITLTVTEGEIATVAVQLLNELIAQSATLIRQAGLLSPQAWDQALVCPDGMLHQAASRKRCGYVSDSCYQPTNSEQPRSCPAQEQGKQGCACDTLACQPSCRFAPARDPKARVVVYAGSNQPQGSPNRPAAPDQVKPGRAKVYYGYRSLPIQLADDQRRFSLVLLDDFRSANEREEIPGTALLTQVPIFYPDLTLAAVAGDAAFGYDLPLAMIYQLGAKRVVDLRAHETDKDKTLWPLRGYDDRGRPLCEFGYAFTANGFDPQKQRHKWCCNQACTTGAKPRVELDRVAYPPHACPYRQPDRPHGQIINLAERFADGSIRLVRDLPVDSPAWKRTYHRARNAVEGRNSTFQAWGLKRLPVYGTPRGKATLFLADVWLNLTTLARLVREATLAAWAA